MRSWNKEIQSWRERWVRRRICCQEPWLCTGPGGSGQCVVPPPSAVPREGSVTQGLRLKPILGSCSCFRNGFHQKMASEDWSKSDSLILNVFQRVFYCSKKSFYRHICSFVHTSSTVQWRIDNGSTTFLGILRWLSFSHRNGRHQLGVKLPPVNIYISSKMYFLKCVQIFCVFWSQDCNCCLERSLWECIHKIMQSVAAWSGKRD